MANISMAKVVEKLHRLEDLGSFAKRFRTWSLKERIVGVVFLMLYFLPVVFFMVANWWVLLMAAVIFCIVVTFLYRASANTPLLYYNWFASRLVFLFIALIALYTSFGWRGPVGYLIGFGLAGVVWVRSR